ncbi:hypothetical protein ACTMTF_37610 [Nonomuraea sp. ZG12]|uniref:hypothetical protein n=1 Tax=Nonomuraea sp. ZG12 TaxID=3452207 RepID=UPI003F891A69
MPKFPDLSTYAADIAPVIDAVHVNVHAAARAVREQLAGAPDPSPGFLNDLRFTLPLRPLTRAGLAAVYRYATAAERESAIQDHLKQGTLSEAPDGLLHATDRGLATIQRLYALHAAAVERVWPGPDVPALAALTAQVLTQAQQDHLEATPGRPGSGRSGEAGGGAFAVVVPPYEPQGTPPGVLLFNRLAALRYHRADAHAAAWQEAGLSVAEIVALKPGPARERIESRTNQRAARPYRNLTESERAFMYGGLLRLA